MFKTILSLFLLVALWSPGSAFAHSRCDRQYVSGFCAPFPPHVIVAPRWGSALPYAEPHDVSGNIILEGAATAGAPEGD